MRQYILNLKNLAINVLEKEGTGLTLIFVHGNSMSSKIWQKQFSSEVLADYRLLALDLPGHGDSSHSSDPDADYNVLSYGEMLAEFIAKTNAENIVLVGHSLGANAVIEVLPLINNCKGCVLLGASLVHSAADVAATFLPNPAASIFFSADYTDEDVKNYVTAVCSKSASFMPDFLAQDFIKTDKNCRAYLAKSVGENKLSDELDILQKAKKSIMVMVGAEDQLFNADYLEKLSLKKWNEKIFEIEHAGHIAQFENAEDFNACLHSFCQSVLL